MPFKTYIADRPELIFKEVDLSNRHVSAYYSAWNNIDADGDIGRKGMTLKTVAEQGPKSANPRIKHFLNHNITQPLSKLTDMGEDNHGPFYSGTVGNHNLGTDYLKMVDSGLITEHSYMLEPTRYTKTSTGLDMQEVKIWEVSSLTAWGANPMTPFISVSKSLSSEDRIKYLDTKIKAVEKFCRNTDATDDTIQSLLICIKQMQEAYAELISSTPAAVEAPEPPKQDNYSSLLKSINSVKTIFN
ncbi:HK97 family phage prohead protease [Chitinophaga sp. Hz27]|uniref:HK97 family phage prohead protease n=1 Tax=Chitinophaga sp. Hz27 TaxID=3347169 RepID=UPI0035DF979C